MNCKLNIVQIDKLKRAREILCELVDWPYDRVYVMSDEYKEIMEVIKKIEDLLGVIQ